ncbi:glycosyltransferase family 9 protein [Altibacter sp. HG106]|uniref:glycosyltransferase family 9 protein n=1 Tax=Altibacter sp. HG106 TaxID=3023937 RepID=UPI00235085FD|nr:glycosyltransferase family 9 protein [Altibacter sp. HG106]MDC7993954.1 glycosyltransferase family 9 protein [Altibacter sp. HG106]
MKQILVIQNKRIGDVLISSVIAQNIKKVFPESKITYFVYDYTAGVLEENPNIDHIIRISEAWLKKLPNLVKTLRKVRRDNYDIIFDPYAKFQSRMMCLCSGAEYRIGLKRAHKQLKLPFYTHPISFLEQGSKPCGKAIEDRVHMVSDVFLLKTPDEVPKIYLTSEEKQYDAIAHIQQPVLMLGVLGSTPNKSMPYPYIARIVDWITEHYQVTVLFNYAPHQKAEAKRIYEQCAHQEQIELDIYENSIRGFIRLMNQCKLLIANEGGSVHIAKALNKPTFTVYSPFIHKAHWATFEDGVMHKSIHLRDEKPEAYSQFSREERKKVEANPQKLYQLLTPELIIASLAPFMEHHLGMHKK